MQKNALPLFWERKHIKRETVAAVESGARIRFGLYRLDLEFDGDLVADHQAAGFDRLGPDQTELLAIDVLDVTDHQPLRENATHATGHHPVTDIDLFLPEDEIEG